jgi:hypothetical protein
MVCPSCQTSNLQDYKYCRECGTRLPAPDGSGVDSTEGQVEQLLQQSFTLLDEGRADEALLAAQTALALNPLSASAHSVAGLIYERSGRLTEAIDAYQRVVELNPGSVVDREKLDALLGRPPAPPKRFRLTPVQGAVAAAIGAGVVVFGVGLALVGGPPKSSASAASPAAGPSGTLQPLSISAQDAAPVTLPAPPRPAATGTLQPLTPRPAAPPAGRSNVTAPYRPAVTGGWRPSPGSWRVPAPPAPEQRVGLPPVIHTPPAASTGLQPAPIGEVVPVGPPPQVNPAGPAQQTAASAPEPAPAPKPVREPLEPDTGFIRIGPAKQPAPAPPPNGAAQPGGAPRPTISVTVGGGGDKPRP